jgi:hypothetical protein
MNIETSEGNIVFKNPIGLDDFSEAISLFERLIKAVSGNDMKTVTFKEFTDWLATTDYVEVKK